MARSAEAGSITRAHAVRVRGVRADEGRRRPSYAVLQGYRPQFHFRTTDVTGSVELDGGAEMVMPGDNIKMMVELIAPIAMDQGLRFAIREGGQTVGSGVVSRFSSNPSEDRNSDQ